jgi:hypothetical protein
VNLYSYVVRYDSGFAPNPFYGFCTLATCKPTIRKTANIGDWIVGIGSADKRIKQGGKLVHAMKVSEILTFDEYFNDQRFQKKKPLMTGSRKQARGDNIYHRTNGYWQQVDSFHSNKDGTPNASHISRDTNINRVLISDQFVFFGCEGPLVPAKFKSDGKSLRHAGRGVSKFTTSKATDNAMINRFIEWFDSLGEHGFVGHPFDWHDTQ